MTKNNPARVRLQQAAVELFQKHGFDHTTAAEIAARAGVTERTFFRHFPDKREVLFGGQDVLIGALTQSLTLASSEVRPLAALFFAFRSVVPLLEANRPFSEPRQKVISATPALHERELAKLEALSDALAAVMRARGVRDVQAELSAQIGVAAFASATVAWLGNESLGLKERLNTIEAEIGNLL